jgi:general stress protein CsbA
MSESATFVIALGGIALFFSGEAQERRRWVSIILAAVLLFAVLGPTDIYPKELRYWIVETAQLKAFSVLMAYVYMMWSLIRNKGLV